MDKLDQSLGAVSNVSQVSQICRKEDPLEVDTFQTKIGVPDRTADTNSNSNNSRRISVATPSRRGTKNKRKVTMMADNIRNSIAHRTTSKTDDELGFKNEHSQASAKRVSIAVHARRKSTMVASPKHQFAEPSL
eukprot:gene17333-5384_t